MMILKCIDIDIKNKMARRPGPDYSRGAKKPWTPWRFRLHLEEEPDYVLQPQFRDLLDHPLQMVHSQQPDIGYTHREAQLLYENGRISKNQYRRLLENLHRRRDAWQRAGHLLNLDEPPEGCFYIRDDIGGDFIPEPGVSYKLIKIYNPAGAA